MVYDSNQAAKTVKITVANQPPKASLLRFLVVDPPHDWAEILCGTVEVSQRYLIMLLDRQMSTQHLASFQGADPATLLLARFRDEKKK